MKTRRLDFKFTPLQLSVSMTLEGSVPNEQTYDADSGEYAPDYSLTPAVIKPTVGIIDRWSPENPNARYKAVSDFSTTYATSRFVEDENTLRLNTLSLSYDLPTGWLRKMHLPFDYVSVAGYAEDLLYLSSVKRERGTDYPYARTYTFSLTLRF